MWFRLVASPRQAASFLILLVWSLVAVSDLVAQSTVSWLTKAEYHGERARVVFEGNLPPSEPEGGAWRMYALDSPRLAEH